MPRRPGPKTIAVAALLLLLAATPFVPRGEDDERSLLPSGEPRPAPAATARLGELTPQARAEIDAVLARGRTLGRVTGSSGKQAPGALVEGLVRCAEFEGQRYCLHAGWTTDTEAEVRTRLTTAYRVAARSGPVERTGGLDAVSALRRTASMSPAERAAAERAELVMAARSVAKVWLLRHQVEGVPLPDGFLDRHPEAVATRTSTGTSRPTASTSPTPSSTVKTQDDYPRRSVVLDEEQVSEQKTTYWCGPTSMQMIAWGWHGEARRQRHWARRLGTTTSGTAITDMVRVVNESTGWDQRRHAGPYITLDIADYDYDRWTTLVMRHIHDYRAPIVLHPVLLKRYYPYLDDDASGHFQVGRGYDKNGDGPTMVGFFEPWNQQRFDPSEPYIDRVQWRSAYKSYRANQAHFQHNIGV